MYSLDIFYSQSRDLAKYQTWITIRISEYRALTHLDNISNRWECQGGNSNRQTNWLTDGQTDRQTSG